MVNNLSSIIAALQLNPHASQSVRQKFKEKGWLPIAANPTEVQLVALALGRIELDASQYGEFIDMLLNTSGMDLIMKQLTGVPYDLLPTFSYLWREGGEGGKERGREGEGGKRDRKGGSEREREERWR